MTILVYIIGALLVLAGALFIGMGVPIVRLEIGWSEIIGGSVAGSAGVVVLAIGVLLTKLEEIRRAILGVGVTAALRDTLAGPAASWEEEQPAERAFPPHPLAPAAASHYPPTEPVVVAAPAAFEPEAAPAEEPRVEPEPALAEAPLHREEPEPAEAVEPVRIPVREPVSAPSLDEGAPALQAHEDHAPLLPPIEAVPPEALAEREEDLPAPELAPPARPVDPARARPNFLASFLARRAASSSLVGRMTPPRERPVTETPLLPLGGLEGDPSPARSPVDLSSGWEERDGPRHMPSGVFDEAYADNQPLGEEEAVPPVQAAAPEPPSPEEPAPEPVLVEAPHEPPLFRQEEPAAPAEEPPVPKADEQPASEPGPLKPIVVGRYNAGSASYIMYSNGMIEVETETGTHQFASMQELKAFIERRDGAKV